MALTPSELDQTTNCAKYVGVSTSIVKQLDKTGGTGGELYEIPSDGYYGVAAINVNSGRCSAYLMSSASAGYIAAAEAGTGTYLRAVTSPIPFKQGTKIYGRAFATSEAYIFKLS